MLIIEHVSHGYGDLKVLEDINIHVKQHEILAITGPSGCGKSTLLNLISELEKLQSGKMINQNRKMSYIFQEDRLIPWKTVWKNIELVKDDIDKEKIKELISEVGLLGFEKYYPAQLSGGMKKRCGIARAFYYESDLLLMDEPFQGLDYTLRQNMLQLLKKLWESQRQSVVFITHEIDEALFIADRIIVLSGRPGKVTGEFILPDREHREQNSKEIIECRQQIMEMICIPTQIKRRTE